MFNRIKQRYSGKLVFDYYFDSVLSIRQRTSETKFCRYIINSKLKGGVYTCLFIEDKSRGGLMRVSKLFSSELNAARYAQRHHDLLVKVIGFNDRD